MCGEGVGIKYCRQVRKAEGEEEFRLVLFAEAHGKLQGESWPPPGCGGHYRKSSKVHSG